MNIALLLTQKFDPNAGGVERSTSKLAKIFRSKEHNVIIISVSNYPTAQEYFEEIPIFNINIE